MNTPLTFDPSSSPPLLGLFLPSPRRALCNNRPPPFSLSCGLCVCVCVVCVCVCGCDYVFCEVHIVCPIATTLMETSEYKVINNILIHLKALCQHIVDRKLLKITCCTSKQKPCKSNVPLVLSTSRKPSSSHASPSFYAA